MIEQKEREQHMFEHMFEHMDNLISQSSGSAGNGRLIRDEEGFQ